MALAVPLSAGDSGFAPLPPEHPWSGASESLAIAPGEPWATPFEDSGQVASPDYEDTMAWLGSLAEAAPEISIVPIGKSPEGRDLVFVIASKEGASTPEDLAANGRPTLLAQAGIHSGEIDGKDASMMLLRDMTVRGTKRELLDKANLIVLPIFSVDAHERRSAYSRMNQRGPEIMGWRTNARNLNLNRDYAKLDTPEMQAVVMALGGWPIDLYYDLHVTDGADYQYDITYGWSGPHAWSPSIANWLDETLRPAADAALSAAGHIPGPLIFQVDKLAPEKGIWGWTASPRFSNGYGDLRHLPTVLVENHSLKPFRQRVLGTYVILEETLRVLGEHGEGLKAAALEDRSRRVAELPLGFIAGADEPETVEFLGIEVKGRESGITGDLVAEYNGTPIILDVPVTARTMPNDLVRRPAAYWVPPSWPEVIKRLGVHGIEMERIEQPRILDLEFYRLREPELASEAYEGHVRVTAASSVERLETTFPAGSVRVPTDQPLGDLAMHLLEPQAGDSFFQWGFFLEILSRTEYAEAYAMEPLAQQMLEEDPELKAEFEKRLEEDEAFRNDPRARLYFFYEKTPYYDQRYLLYPVAREP
jgi:hypothetical protein